MKLIELTKGYSAIVDDEDYEWLSAIGSWCVYVESRSCGIYARAQRSFRIPNGYKVIRMHRAIWERHHGPIPEGITVDHREHGEFGGLDNRLSNLRLATGTQQQFNKRKMAHCSSPFIGVYWNKANHNWVAKIRVDGKKIYLGCFDSELDAALTCDLAKLHTRGVDERKLNFPERLSEYIKALGLAV